MWTLAAETGPQQDQFWRIIFENFVFYEAYVTLIGAEADWIVASERETPPPDLSDEGV